MADNLQLRYKDRFFIALTEDYEVRDFEAAIKKQKPNATAHQIHAALLECAKSFASNHPRAAIQDCVLKRLP